MITNVGSKPSQLDSVRELLKADAIPIAEYPLWVEGIALPELVNHPGFELHDVQLHKEGNSTDCVVEFSFEPAEGGRPYLRGGVVVLDPEHLWVVRRYDCRWEDEGGPGTGEAEWEYAYEEGKEYPVPVRRTRRLAGLSSGIEMEWTHEYAEYRYRAIPENEFTLTAFDLPEIGQVTTRSRGLFGASLVGSGFLVILLGAVLLKRHRCAR